MRDERSDLVDKLLRKAAGSSSALLVNAGNKRGESALMTATILAASVAGDPERSGSALNLAVDIAKKLAEVPGANLLAVDSFGWDCLFHIIPEQKGEEGSISSRRIAVLGGLAETLFEMIRTSGGTRPVDMRDKLGYTSLFWICAAGIDAYEPLVHAFVRRGADPNAVVAPPDDYPAGFTSPLNAARDYSERPHNRRDMTDILSLLTKDPAERAALPLVQRGSRLQRGSQQPPQPPAPPLRAGAEPPEAGTGAGTGGAGPSSDSAAGRDSARGRKRRHPPEAFPRDELQALLAVIEAPTVDLNSVVFSEQKCYKQGELQIASPQVNAAKDNVQRAWKATQRRPPVDRKPKFQIIRCYGVSGGGSAIKPPYTDNSPFYCLHKNVENFFESPFFGEPCALPLPVTASRNPHVTAFD